MNLPEIAQLMEVSGFKNVTTSSEYEGILFQIVGDAKIGLRNMTTTVRAIGELDRDAAKKVAEEFLELHRRKSVQASGDSFLYCLLIERKDPKASEWLLDAIYKGTHNPDHTVGPAGGRFLIADADSGWLYMNHTKEGVVKYEKKMIDVLLRAGVAHPPRQASVSAKPKVDLPKIAQMMESSGFKNVRMSSEYEGVQFQIVGEATIGLQKLTTIVRVVNALDDATAQRIAQEFLGLHEKKSSYVFGTFFLYCLITERMDEQPTSWLIETIGKGTHGLKDTLGAGGGHMIVADAASGNLTVMKTREGIVKYERRMVDILAAVGLVRQT